MDVFIDTRTLYSSNLSAEIKANIAQILQPVIDIENSVEDTSAIPTDEHKNVFVTAVKQLVHMAKGFELPTVKDLQDYAFWFSMIRCAVELVCLLLKP